MIQVRRNPRNPPQQKNLSVRTVTNADLSHIDLENAICVASHIVLNSSVYLVCNAEEPSAKNARAVAGAGKGRLKPTRTQNMRIISKFVQAKWIILPPFRLTACRQAVSFNQLVKSKELLTHTSMMRTEVSNSKTKEHSKLINNLSHHPTKKGVRRRIYYDESE